MLLAYTLNPNKSYLLNKSHNLVVNLSQVSKDNSKTNKNMNKKLANSNNNNLNIFNKIKLFCVINNSLLQICTLLQEDESQRINLTLINDLEESKDIILLVKGGSIDLLGTYEIEEKDDDSLNKDYKVLVESKEIINVNKYYNKKGEESSNNNKDLELKEDNNEEKDVDDNLSNNSKKSNSNSIIYDDSKDEEISLKDLLKRKRVNKSDNLNKSVEKESTNNKDKNQKNKSNYVKKSK